MLFCILMTLVTIGHFSFVLFLHNWFYSKPFPRLLGDLIQATHILFGIIGLLWVYTVAQKVEVFIANPDLIFLSDLLLDYGLFCLCVGSILLPVNEIFRNVWRLPLNLFKQQSRCFDYTNHFLLKNKFDSINDSFKLEVVSAVVSTPLLPINSKLKILHLSDFHFGGNNNYAYFQFVLAEVEKEIYDFVFF